MTKPTVFISYSHQDEEWKDRLVTHLGVLHHQGLLDLWDDRRIGAGEDWYQEIQEAMATASVGVLLVSANSLTSEFILREEVTRLLERRDKEGLPIFPVIVKPCAWKAVPWLRRMQVRPRDGRPLSAGTEHQIDADLTAIATEVHDLLKDSSAESVPVRHNRMALQRAPATPEEREPPMARTRSESEARRAPSPGTQFRRLGWPLRLLAWDLPARLGFLARGVGEAVDEVTNWVIGIVILVVITLAVLGILTQTQVANLLLKTLGVH